VYLYDKVEHIVIMDDCGSNSVTLKEYMQNGRCSVETAHRIGKEVGNFIGHLHTWGKGNPDVYEFFEQNQQGKIMSSWVFYGRLLSTFSSGLGKLRDPDVFPSEAERGALEKIAEESGDAMRKVTGTVCSFFLSWSKTKADENSAVRYG
jgi:5-methylthioribose kinase